jgi:hypothetical protein
MLTLAVALGIVAVSDTSPDRSGQGFVAMTR